MLGKLGRKTIACWTLYPVSAPHEFTVAYMLQCVPSTVNPAKKTHLESETSQSSSAGNYHQSMLESKTSQPNHIHSDPPRRKTQLHTEGKNPTMVKHHQLGVVSELWICWQTVPSQIPSQQVPTRAEGSMPAGEPIVWVGTELRCDSVPIQGEVRQLSFTGH